MLAAPSLLWVFPPAPLFLLLPPPACRGQTYFFRLLNYTVAILALFDIVSFIDILGCYRGHFSLKKSTVSNNQPKENGLTATSMG